MKNIRNNQKGQSLMELLIAISILVVALTATIILIVKSIEASREGSNKLSATNFAREGIEIVRNIRDGNWINPDETVLWNDGLTVGSVVIPHVDSDTWDTDPTSLVASTGFNDANARIWENADGEYVQDPGTPLAGGETQFFRVMFLSPICHDTSDPVNEEIVPKEDSDTCVVQFGANYRQVGIRVIAEVRWPKADSSREVIIEENLYDWQVL